LIKEQFTALNTRF